MNKKSYTSDDEKRGQRIKAVRKMNSLTQENMAELFNISVSMVKKLESGENNITIPELKCLRNEFDVSADFILFGDVVNEAHFEYKFESESGEEKVRILLRILLHLCGEDRNKFMNIIQKIISETDMD